MTDKTDTTAGTERTASEERDSIDSTPADEINDGSDASGQGADQTPSGDAEATGTETAATATGSVTNLRRTTDGEYYPLSDEQNELLRAFRTDDSLVIGQAGSGAGKTGVSVECFGDAVWRDLDAGNDLPEGVVFVTFTRTAARDIREEAESRLQDHVDACELAGATEDPVYRRWNDVQSWIQERAEIRTLDSLTLDWYGRLAAVSSLPSEPSVGDDIEKETVLDRVEEKLTEAASTDAALADAIQLLEARYGDGVDESGPAPWVTALDEALQTGRRYCQDATWVCQQLREGHDACFGGGRPESQRELRAAVSDLSNESLSELEVNDECLAYAQQTYDVNETFVEGFCLVLERFEACYDEISLDEGVFEHTDVTYLVTTLLDPSCTLPADVDVPYVDDFREQLLMDYSHVVIDEAQDNSYGHLQAIRHLFDASMVDTEGLYVGDLKQSIYSWRAAEPALFAELIGVDAAADGSLLGVNDVNVVGLTNSFRSHPHILDFVNATFPDVFEDPARGNLGSFTVPYQPLRARRLETDPNDPHIHVVRIPDHLSNRPQRVNWEARAMARRLRGAVDEGALPIDVNRALAAVDENGYVDRRTPAAGSKPSMESAEGGQTAFIFRSMSHAQTHARELDAQGFRTAILSGTSLFETPEVQIVEGLLRFVEDLDSEVAVQWLVESPLTTLDTQAEVALQNTGFDLDRAANTLADAITSTTGDEVVTPIWENDPVPIEDARRVQEQVAALRNLRESLRNRRHGKKADLIRALVRETGYDTTLLASENGFQRAANVDRLIELVAEWEEDEPLDLSELLSNMRRGREAGSDGPDAAITADTYSADTVLLMSAHRAKGKEFDVVVLADLYSEVSGTPMANKDMLADRTTGMALRPWAGDTEPPSPSPRTDFDTFWLANETDYFEDVGHTWVAEHRIEQGPNAGQFAHDHPFMQVVENRRAEEFRTLYMAVTRACDHLIVGLQDRPGKPNYTSWGDTLWDALNMSAAPATGTHRIRGADANENPQEVPIGIDDLPVANDPSNPRFTATSRWRAGQYRRLTGEASVESPTTPAAPESETHVRPRTLSPSGASECLDDLSAAFRTVCDEVSQIGEDRTTVDDMPPAGLEPRAWGDVVHATVEETVDDPFPPSAITADGERLARIVDAALDAELGSEYEARDEAARLLRREVLPAFAATETYVDLRSASTQLGERPTGAIFEEGPRPLFIRGWFDLAYPVQSGWRLCDLKTGSPPATASLEWFAENSKTAGYGVQLAVYAWLLEQEYEIDITSVRLTYLWPTPVEYELSLDVEAVPSLLEEVAKGVSLAMPQKGQGSTPSDVQRDMNPTEETEDSDT